MNLKGPNDGYKLLYRVSEAAEYLSLSRTKVYELIRSGVLVSIRVDGSRRIKADDLRASVHSLGNSAAHAAPAAGWCHQAWHHLVLRRQSHRSGDRYEPAAMGRRLRD
jgi:excisionase family DNA binding protein